MLSVKGECTHPTLYPCTIVGQRLSCTHRDAGACMSEEITGRAKGGHARAEALSAEERTETARRAARARWDETVPTATHIGELTIDDLVLPCAVLPDGTRVISQGAMA